MCRRMFAPVALVCAALLSACGADAADLVVAPTAAPGETAAPPTAPPPTVQRAVLTLVDFRDAPDGEENYPEVPVEASDNVFGANAVIRVRPGTEVIWTNVGRNDHNIIPLEPSKGFGVGQSAFKPGDVHEFEFDEPGVYEYFCDIHGSKDKGMVGAVVVGDGEYVPGQPTAAPDPDALLAGTIRVPADVATIQEAVNRAAPEALVLIAPGVYHEAVEVTNPRIVIRGEDRNATVLDGEFELTNGFKVLANGVAIENITARNYTANGFFWTGVLGYRGSYITAINNGDYGVYAFDSTHGQFDNSYASGSPDSGFYIGQCTECDAVITNVTAEHNQLGYSGTNASEVIIANSLWMNNRAGIVPNSLDSEKFPPVARVHVIGNTVIDNDNGDASRANNQGFDAVFGVGIVAPGAIDSVIERNYVSGHMRAGIAVAPNPDKNFWPAERNRIIDNVVENTDPGGVDLAVVAAEPGKNCFVGNTFTSSAPLNIETVFPCDGENPAVGSDVTAGAVDINDYLDTSQNPPGLSYQDQPEPPAQPQMPDALTAPAVPADPGVVPLTLDLDAITVPLP